MAVTEKITDYQNAELRLQELESPVQKRLLGRRTIEIYQARMADSSDTKVRERALKKGDLVLIVRRPMILTHKSKGKFEPKWEGWYIINRVYSNSAYAVFTVEGDSCIMPINGKFFKRY